MKLVAVLTVVIAMVATDSLAGAASLAGGTFVPPGVRTGEGKLVPLTRPASLSDKDWVRVEYPERGQQRVTMQVQVESSVPDANSAGVASLITTALMSTHCVKLYDPAIRRSGRGPKYVLSVRITEYEMQKRGHSIGGLGSGLLSHVTHNTVEGASVGSHKAEVGLSVTLLSAKTGEVLGTTELKGKSSSLRFGLSGVSVAGVAATDVETWSNPAMGYAVRVAAAKLAYKVSEWVGRSGR